MDHLDTMVKPQISFSPAECCPKTCEDEWCPYMHHDSWYVGDTHYSTKAEAEAALTATEQ
jgi:hypothetical protein